MHFASQLWGTRRRTINICFTHCAKSWRVENVQMNQVWLYRQRLVKIKLCGFASIALCPSARNLGFIIDLLFMHSLHLLSWFHSLVCLHSWTGQWLQDYNWINVHMSLMSYFLHSSEAIVPQDGSCCVVQSTASLQPATKTISKFLLVSIARPRPGSFWRSSKYHKILCSQSVDSIWWFSVRKDLGNILEGYQLRSNLTPLCAFIFQYIFDFMHSLLSARIFLGWSVHLKNLKHHWPNVLYRMTR